MNRKSINKFIGDKHKTIKIITGDMFLNIIATMMPIFVLQFILLPKVAQTYNGYEYGLMLTLISLITLSVQALSISLTNSRLLLDQQYKDKGFNGDFNILLIFYTIINIMILIIGTYLYVGEINLTNISLILIFSTAQLVRRYLLVSFRIRIFYKGILFSNIILVIGYFLGILLFLFTEVWQLIYITGEFLSLIYVIKKTKLLREPIKITPFFKKTTKYGFIMLCASFMGTAISNIDRLLLYPLLGAKMVTIYYISTLFGKSISLLIGPINNVILTYISKMKKFEVNLFKLMLFTSIILGAICYVFILLISEPILTLIYPVYVSEAMDLIYITSLTAIVMMISNVINPVIMRFCNISWQIWINFSNIVIYCIIAYYLVGMYNIYGFCYAALIASVVKLLFLIYIFIKRGERLT